MKAKLEIKGEIAEDYLYEFVNAHSGLSIYELSKRLGWSTGKVYNIIKVLEDDGLVKTIKIEERASIKGKTYYFCAPGCKKAFVENPEEYIGEE